MSLVDKQFTRVFAPKQVKNMILPPRIKDRFISMDEIGKHFLFHGVSGTGKSTLADIISKPYPRLKINCRVNGKIEDLRGLIDEFCSEPAFSETGKTTKVVWLDEIDGVSAAFFEGLKGFIDKYEVTTKFIATSNHVHKIDSASLSRFDSINFNATENEEEELRSQYMSRVNAIVTKVKMKIDDAALKHTTQKYFPDFRKPLQLIQTHYELKHTIITKDSIIDSAAAFKDLYDLILVPNLDPIKFHKEIIVKYNDKSLTVLESFHENLVDYIVAKKAHLTGLIPTITFCTAKYMNMALIGVDAALALKACVWEINKSIK